MNESNPQLKAIETVYNGCRFRSRLEARWAVFMDSLRINFLYEPEAYSLNGVGYLPDFWVPHIRAHIEIKPSAPSHGESEKALRLSQITGRPVYILQGSPEVPNYDTNWYRTGSGAMLHLCTDGEDFTDEHHLWCECPNCHRIEIQFDGRSERISCPCNNAESPERQNFNSPRLLSAYAKSRGYRFEPGASNS